MESLWRDDEAARIGPSPLALRVYTSRLLGREPSLVLHGGGNTSVKTTAADLFGTEEELIYVKGSGWDLATIEARGFAPVRLAPLRRLADLDALSDTDMVRAQRAAMTDPTAPTPSVEAVLHAIIPHAFVDHTHADAVVAITNTANGAARIEEIYGKRVVIVPYVMPGFVLAKAVWDQTRDLDWQAVEGMVLLHHGVFSFGPDARTSYEGMIALVSEAESYLQRSRAMVAAPAGIAVERITGERLLDLARLRRDVGAARGGPLIARLDDSPEAVGFASRPDVREVATRGPLTPDHVIRTKPLPCVAAGDWDAAVTEYADEYRAYVARHAGPAHVALDPAPRWCIWEGRGFVGLGATMKDAGIVLDIARHTGRAIAWAERLGGWGPLPEKDLFQVEYWELEQAKVGARHGAPLTGRVALVTGAASGIGRACAESLHAAGAAVLATDINPNVSNLFAKDDAMGWVADATDPVAVRASVDEAIRRFGGLDILISNAGLFPPSERLEELKRDTWDQSLDLNLSSHLFLLRAAIPYLKLGFEPSVVVVGSKNVPAPGPGAGAYSVAKAGLTQLARVAALELGKHGIRVNVVHPHAVFDTSAWSPEVIAERARHYDLTPDQYRTNNLLRVEVTSADVAAVVVALAGPTFSKTTGAQIPIDGGSERVI
jgi:rhamnose utilization protein RhaD (predicted bifunctional aldolase and dehydrogenase)/NAD(P)-dependent dehydrogenase (short-subunit alcohol dehydrogenase family)